MPIERIERYEEVEVQDLKIGDCFLIKDGKARYVVDPKGYRCTNVGGTPGIYKDFEPNERVKKIVLPHF